jgi:hypothetical protein
MFIKWWMYKQISHTHMYSWIVFGRKKMPHSYYNMDVSPKYSTKCKKLKQRLQIILFLLNIQNSWIYEQRK